LCGGTRKRKEERKAEKGKRIAILEEGKIIRWVIDDKED